MRARSCSCSMDASDFRRGQAGEIAAFVALPPAEPFWGIFGSIGPFRADGQIYPVRMDKKPGKMHKLCLSDQLLMAISKLERNYRILQHRSKYGALPQSSALIRADGQLYPVTMDKKWPKKDKLCLSDQTGAKASATAACAATGVALHAGAVADQRVVATFAAGIAFVPLHFCFPAGV